MSTAVNEKPIKKIKQKASNYAHVKNITKYYKLLKTSWNVQTKLFFENSTLHGVRYIAEKGRPFIEKLMWFCCISVGAVATMIIIVSLWEKFQTNPTITGLDTDFHSWDVPFPAITVCQNIPSNISKIEHFIETNMSTTEKTVELITFLTKLSQLSYNTIVDFKQYTNSKYVKDDQNLKTLVFQIMNNCEEIFDLCKLKSEKLDCCTRIFPIFTESGFCYSFNSRHYERKIPEKDIVPSEFEMEYIKEADTKWSFKFLVFPTTDDNKYAIYIHNSDDIPGEDLQPQHNWDHKISGISFSVKQTYTTDDTRQLSIKQRRCIFSDEVKLTVDYMYTYTACTRQCRMENARRLCGCVPHFYPETEKYRHCKITELSCIADNVNAIKSVDKCNCELGCLNTVYEVEKLNEFGSSDEVNNELSCEFVSWPMVRYKREVLFGWVDLLVSFGGIAGLFLGFSLLSGVEIIYYFTIRALCMLNRERTELEKLVNEETVQVTADYDLSLVPYFIAKPSAGNGMKEIANEYYIQNISLSKRRVAPMTVKEKLTMVKENVVYPPFGIEFLP